ncbi:hypothetical protein ACOMICROBIO_GDFFDHBD_03002 [Vibrio sp. B1REV9]|uniref:hypothetical protein n=1 Tax=Vibrio sp. B1REV9 TaxID=2751179 RepID=UPI001AF1F4E5|nr:hypothetical protein [Vibrio sp. B1REV9]CAE6937708.1 hypothetical protein ACOMICROBIO_GDFFDHBD_03002 [Vibrio sp. B1REV9]
MKLTKFLFCIPFLIPSINAEAITISTQYFIDHGGSLDDVESTLPRVVKPLYDKSLDHGFLSVVHTEHCTATWLGDSGDGYSFFLSAAHCFDGSEEGLPINESIFDWSGKLIASGDGVAYIPKERLETETPQTDVAILKLPKTGEIVSISGDVVEAPYLYDGSSEEQIKVAFVGYGGIGLGMSDFDSLHAIDKMQRFYGESEITALTVNERRNLLVGYDASGLFYENQWARLSSPSNYHDREITDAGAALWKQDLHGWVVVGVADGRSPISEQFGEQISNVRIHSYINWIQSVFPEVKLNSEVEQKEPPQGCIVRVDTGDKYCLGVNEWSGYSLPKQFAGHEVYVHADQGTMVLLSDWDNLSYNHIAGFQGTVNTENLRNVQAWNGKLLNFDKPRSMKVASTPNVPFGCIISGDLKYCLTADKKLSKVPEWLKGKEVYIQADSKVQVQLSNMEQPKPDDFVSFTGTVDTNKLKNVSTDSGELIDLSMPSFIKVVPTSEPLGCIVSLVSGEKYCLPKGESTGRLPDWIKGKQIYVQATQGVKVELSDVSDFADGRTASFRGTVESEDLKGIQADNGLIIDFANPYAMRVKEDLDEEPFACVVSVKDGSQFCLSSNADQERIPERLLGQQVYLQSPRGVKVTLENKSGEHHVFWGTVDSERLKHPEISLWTPAPSSNSLATSTEPQDFDFPVGMKVTRSNRGMGCVVSNDDGERFCLPGGERSAYKLPFFILGKSVYVDTDEDVTIWLSDWSNLSYNRIGVFSGKVETNDLKHVLAWNGQYLDFDKPWSMRAVNNK